MGTNYNDDYTKQAAAKGHIHILGMSLGFVALIIYLIASIACSYLWSRLWVIFLLIPVLDSVVGCIKVKSIKPLQFSVLVLFCYLTIGLFFNIWHPTWLIFIAIPIWSCVVRGKKLFEFR